MHEETKDTVDQTKQHLLQPYIAVANHNTELFSEENVDVLLDALTCCLEKNNIQYEEARN